MPRQFSARTYSRIVKFVYEHGTQQPSSRGLTKEVLNISLELRNVRDRLTTESWRKLNFPFAIAEWLGTMLGIDQLEFFSQFVHSYSDYSTDGSHVDGAYGTRIVASPDDVFRGDYNQFRKVIEHLKENMDSRRAVVSIYNWKDLYGYGGMNTPCTLTIQFLVRNGKLLMITNMRSNDAIRGLTNDLIVFTMTQEFVANQLGIPCGPYFHNAASFHLYDDDWKYAKVPAEKRFTAMMAKMPLFGWDELTQLANVYRVASSTHEHFLEIMEPLSGNLYLLNLGAAARAWVLRKTDPATAERWYRACTDYGIRRVLRPWLTLEG